jgi:hypothetical protein
LDSAPPTLLERGSRHCHGINYAQNPLNERNGLVSSLEKLRVDFRSEEGADNARENSSWSLVLVPRP